jgi:chemotaxis protein CheX
MNVEYINPFIEASQQVIQMMTGIKPTLGKVHLKNSPYPSDSVIPCCKEQIVPFICK